MSVRRKLIRRGSALFVAAAGIVVSVTPALGLLLWTLTASPLTVTSGVATNYTLTATNLDLLSELGCLEVDLPPSFTIIGASAGNASNGDAWEAVVFPNKVAAHSLSGGGRLKLGQSITFTISAIATQAGTWTWPNHAHAREDCGGAEELGSDLTILVVPAPTPTPAPTQTPAPTPTPTPVLSIEPVPTLGPLPTLQPLPSIGLATPAPTRGPGSLVASPTPDPSGTPPAGSPAISPSPTPTEGEGPSGSGDTPGGAQGGSIPAALLEIAAGAGSGEAGDPVTGVSLGPLGIIDGITVWAIPGAILGGPGLLVILWVLAQTGVALAWIPAVRRLRGKDTGDGPFSSPRWTVSP